MKTKNFIIAAAACLALNPLTRAGAQETPELRAIALADIQYATYAPRMNRFYVNSIDKMLKASAQTADYKPAFVINLGDTVDSKYVNLGPILQMFKKFNAPVYHVMGNHDYEDTQDNIKKTLEDLGMAKSQNYVFDFGDWRFVCLDTNTLGKYNKLITIGEKAESDAAWAAGEAAKSPALKPYNGGASKATLKWLNKTLREADEENKRVVIFAHSPLLPFGPHSAINTDAITQVIFKHPCVKAYINGHNHKGAYESQNGVHFLTLPALVENKDEVTYAALEFYKDKIEVIGRGKAPTMTLQIK